MASIGLKDVFVYVDGEYHKLGHVDRIELEAEEELSTEDIRTICPTEQTFECQIELVNRYSIMKIFAEYNNWRRFHGKKPRRWRTLERIVKKEGKV